MSVGIWICLRMRMVFDIWYLYLVFVFGIVFIGMNRPNVIKCVCGHGYMFTHAITFVETNRL